MRFMFNIAKKYLIKASRSNADLANISSEKSERFSELWQQKRYDEAVASFPDQWDWITAGEDKTIRTDMPTSYGVGVVMSERAYHVISQEFPEVTKLHHEVMVGDEKFHWFFSGDDICPLEECLQSDLNVFQIAVTYKIMFSQKFVDVWEAHGFTSGEFVEATPENIDRIFI